MTVLMGFKTGILIGAAMVSTLFLALVMKHAPTIIDPSRGTQPALADGSHCLSRHPAQHAGLMEALNNRINPSGSVVVEQTRLGPLRPDGTHTITVDYTFRKFSRAHTTGRATGTVRNDDCSFDIKTLER